MFLNKVGVGIDIGSQKIKLVKVKRVKQGYELINYASIETPFGAVEYGSIINPDLITKELQRLVKQFKLKGKSIISVVSGPQVYTRQLIMPHMKPKELRDAVYYQATTFLPIPIEETVMDLYPIRDFETEEGPQTELFFVAVRRQQVEILQGCCKDSGLKLKVIDIEPLALNRALADEDTYGIKALLNIGASRSYFSVFEQNNLLFHRTLPFGCAAILDPYNQNTDEYFFREVLSEVARSMEYFNMQFKKNLEVIILSGPGAQLNELRKVLADGVNIMVEVAKLNHQLILPPDISEEDINLLQYEFPVAIGLALREVTHG